MNHTYKQKEQLVPLCWLATVVTVNMCDEADGSDRHDVVRF